MSNITVIVPIHVFGDKEIELLNNAIKSVPNDVEIILSVKNGTPSKTLKNVENNIDGRNITIVDNSEGDSFAELVNAAVGNVQTKYFSILEFDDEYTPIWFKNANEYIDFMPEVSVFMVFEDIIDFNNKKYINLGNVEAWASSFSNEVGYIDLDCLQNYFDFYLTGSIFNTSDWLEIGGLKPSIKITFWYEFLLRATNKSKKVYVIPKVGYNHYLGREDSLVEKCKEIDKEETQWWFDLAKREMFYSEDRKKEYKPNDED